MKKLNNKGLTLAELIVSFALVSVAMLYFYQTVSTVSKLYKKSKDETNNFAETTYLLRLVDAKLDDIKKTYHSKSGKNIDLTGNDAKDRLTTFCDNKLNATCTVSGPETDKTKQNYHYYTISITPTNGGTMKHLYRRASIQTKVYKVVTYTTKPIEPDNVQLSTATAENDYGVDWGKNTDKALNGATQKGVSWNPSNSKCAISESDCKYNNSYKDKAISFSRENFRQDNGTSDEALWTVLYHNRSRIYRVCTGNVEMQETPISYIDPEDGKRKAYRFFGKWKVTGCDKNMTSEEIYDYMHDKANKEKNVYIASVVGGDWGDVDELRCQGVAVGKNDTWCCSDNTKRTGLRTDSGVTRCENKIGRGKLTKDWLTETTQPHKYKNNSYEDSLYYWKIIKKGVVNSLYGTRHRVIANTRVTFERSYEYISEED